MNEPMILIGMQEVVELKNFWSDLVTTSTSAVALRSAWDDQSAAAVATDVRMVVFGGSSATANGNDIPSVTSEIQLENPMTMASDQQLEADDDRDLFLFVTYGILLTVIGLMGLAGNAMSIVVLSRPQMRSSINCCLIGLASFDIVVLVTSVLMFGVLHLCSYTGTFPFYERSLYPYLVPLALYPFGLIAQTGSVWVTVTVTIERFVAVCLPLHAKSLCTYGRARVYIVIISLFSILYNLPRFWEVERDEVVFDTVTNETVYILQPSWLRQNRTYINVYITWMYLFALYFVPFVLLAVLNGVIWVKVRRANRERQQLSRLQKKEMGLAIMLFCVVVVFFICNALALLVNILEVVGIIIDELTVSSNLLVTMNSSVNFCIYCIFGQKFRKILLKTVCSRCFRRVFCRWSARSMMGTNNELDESFGPVSTGTMAETRTLLMFNNNGNGNNSLGSGGGVNLNQHLVKMETSPSSTKSNFMSMSIMTSTLTSTNNYCNNGTGVLSQNPSPCRLTMGGLTTGNGNSRLNFTTT